ncbi:FAD-dependent monooxygenase [Methyloceanibacter sp.]|uniref:FAD-dependent monooxygenase n=1 Tax=Methyloceanibacter sp. TaxID=1965321 RepID=UPI00351AE96C
MAETKIYDVIIAGGGFVGMSLALALGGAAPKGFRVALVDAEPAESTKSDARALALSAASKGLLSVLGIWPALAGNAEAITTIEITDSSLDAKRRPHLLGFDDDLKPGESGAYMIENEDFIRGLSSAVLRAPAIEMLAPDSVTSFAATPFAIEARLASGGRLGAKLLIAADGKRSRLRERAGIKCVGWSYPQLGIVTTVAHAKPHHGKAVQHFLPGGPFAMLPLKGNRCSIVWTEDKTMGEAIMASDESVFLAELAKRFGTRLCEIALAGPRQSFPLDFQVARSFVGERLALVGDAAHAVHPLAGQGLNIGLRDVAALTEIVVEGARLGMDVGASALLERYERWRRFDSAFSATVMDGLNRLFSNDNAPLRALRDLGLGIVDNAPRLKRAPVREAAGVSGTLPRLLKGERL